MASQDNDKVGTPRWYQPNAHAAQPWIQWPLANPVVVAVLVTAAVVMNHTTAGLA
jgi:hypothetical protein